MQEQMKAHQGMMERAQPCSNTVLNLHTLQVSASIQHQDSFADRADPVLFASTYMLSLRAGVSTDIEG